MHLSVKFTTVVYLFGTVHPHDDGDGRQDHPEGARWFLDGRMGVQV